MSAPDYATICARAIHDAKRAAVGVSAPFTLAHVAAIIREYCGPKKKAKRGTKQEPTPPKRDALFDGLASACGYDLHSITRSAATQIGMAKAEILAASPTVTPGDMSFRAQAYRRKYRDAPCTPLALAKHWPEFAANTASVPRPAAPAVVRDPAVPVAGWAMLLRHHVPGHDAAALDALCAMEWSELPLPVREAILKV